MRLAQFSIIAASFVVVAAASSGAENLLRNGSFEGGLLYWHNIKSGDHELARGGAATGEYALKLKNGYVMSAPFVASRGEPFTVTFYVKAEQPATVQVSMPPSAREPGQKAKRLWTKEAGQTAKVGTDWQRVSFTWNADVPPDGFWPKPHYLVQIGGEKGKTLFIDGVTVTRGRDAAPEYLPRRAVEVVAECPDLPGYEGAKMNVFEKGATVGITGHFSNPTDKEQKIAALWQLFDYEGEQPVGPATTVQLTLPPGKTISRTEKLLLTRSGCVIARVTAATASSGNESIDSSDHPITSLPYPKTATKPDYRERFGGSFAGGKGMLEKFQRIGFGWTRWYPETKWHNFQKEAGAPFTWHDEKFDLAAAHGVSQHVVLYGWPKGLMEKEHSGQPLPLDMKWRADDARWDDFAIETAWDKYVKAVVAHFRGKSVVFEIENEPELDKWDKHKAEYARFTIRTAKLIKQTDPKARVMVNNVYGIPSGLNAEFFKMGGLQHIDVMSWHDYHEGWLTDARGIRRMRQNMDEAGGKHVEIWFNEGWAFTNTLVDEPIACANLTSAQSTNAQMASVAEMSAVGQKKTILFHTGYETHGLSFWDYSGPGTMLWDWYGNPLPLVAAWNVMSHHIGISEEVAWVRPPGANFAIFDDLRNGRGVSVAYADWGSKDNVEVDLAPLFTALGKAAGAKSKPVLYLEDLMGNATPAPQKLVLRKTSAPVFLYASAALPGKAMADALEPLDRKNASFVTKAGAAQSWALPPSWEGTAKGEREGSVAMADGKPIWKLEQLWPADWKKPENFRPMVWSGTDWKVDEGGFGGQPAANLKDGVLNFGTRAPHGQGNDRHLRTAGLVFVAPVAGNYALSGTATSRIWDGKNKTTLHVLKKTSASVEKVGGVTIPHGGEATLAGQSFALAAGDELVLLPQIDGMFSGGDCKLRDLRVSLGGAPAAGGEIFKLPAVWEGTEKGSAAGNPMTAEGQPIWRADRLFPEDPIMTLHYTPMVWGKGVWTAPDRTQGGHPSLRVADGTVNFGAMGPWGGKEFNYPKTPALVFVAPKSGIYKVRGTAKAKPWDGAAKVFPLSLRKKDAQRVAEIKSVALPRTAEPVLFEAKVEMAAGHELVFTPLLHGLHNNAANISIEGLVIKRAAE